MDPESTIEAMKQAAYAMKMGSDRDAVRAIQAAQDALDAAKAVRLRSIEESKAYEADGASTLNTWVRNELRLDAKDAASLVNASTTLTYLPAVAEAAASGAIRTDHVAAFTYGIKHIGAGVIRQSEPWLLDVARTSEPLELFRVVRALREAVFPDDLDKAWAEGMDKQDIQVLPVPGGWHVTGFLSAAIGAKFKTVLDSVAKPTDKDDHRTGSERRIDGFAKVLGKILEGGLPADKGVRPHLSVILDATEDTPAQLAGYGSIGPKLLDYLSCSTDITPVHIRNDDVLDVGRSHRLATLKQRRAVIARQGGECAAPGCRNTHLEIHHTIWWSRGGRTDIDHLIGLCSRCHHLIHRELLIVTGNARDGLRFTNRDNRAIRAEFKARVRRRRHEREARRTHAVDRAPLAVSRN